MTQLTDPPATAPQNPKTAPESSGLGLPQSTALVMGSIIGVGIFSLPHAIASYGPISLVAMGLATVGAVALASMFAVLSRRVPSAGGPTPTPGPPSATGSGSARRGSTGSPHAENADLFPAVAEALGLDKVRVLRTPIDKMGAQREQRDDGNDFLSVSRAWSSRASATPPPTATSLTKGSRSSPWSAPSWDAVVVVRGA